MCRTADSLALRDVQITLECLNCFADVIPYYRARLQVSQGQVESGTTLRLALADDGSFRLTSKASIPRKYSLEALRQLGGLAGDAVNRIDSLLTKGDRTEVDDLLLRAVRWVGRAAAADRTEDKFLYAGIAIDFVVRPVEVYPIKKHITERTARVLQDSPEIEELKRLHEVRNALVHDGRLEIKEEDTASIQTIALNLVLRILTRSDVLHTITLQDLEGYFQKLMSSDPGNATGADDAK